MTAFDQYFKECLDFNETMDLMENDTIEDYFLAKDKEYTENAIEVDDDGDIISNSFNEQRHIEPVIDIDLDAVELF